MEILLIGEDGSKIGNFDIEEARKIASSTNKDLVRVGKNNVYKIADAGKLKYEQKQRQKRQRAQRRVHKVKEIKLRLSTDIHDLNTKSKRVEEFLSKGLKTKITMQFKGRQLAFKEAGLRKMNDFINTIIDSGKAVIDRAPKFEGKNIVAFLTPSK